MAAIGTDDQNPLRIDPTGTTTQPVSAASLPLPSGAAEETTLAAIKTQTDKLTFDGDELKVIAQTTPVFETRQDTFTTTGNGVTENVSTKPVSKYAIMVKGTGASATSWNVVLEGSLDGTTFDTILTHKSNTGDGKIMASGVIDFPALYFRSRVVSLTLGAATNIVVTILGK